MNTSRTNNQYNNSRAFWASFRDFWGQFWRDLQEHSDWKYEDLPPVLLLEKSKLHRDPTNHDELARADWFWGRRPRLHSTACWILWFLVAFGLPLWLFYIPWIGVPLIVVAVIVGNTEMVRSVRWRRQYELSIDRLIRTTTSGRNSLSGDVSV